MQHRLARDHLALGGDRYSCPGPCARHASRFRALRFCYFFSRQQQPFDLQRLAGKSTHTIWLKRRPTLAGRSQCFETNGCNEVEAAEMLDELMASPKDWQGSIEAAHNLTSIAQYSEWTGLTTIEPGMETLQHY
jgi:hypothetical protein